MTQAVTFVNQLLGRAQLSVVLMGLAILSIGIFISDKMPDPKEEGFAEFVYDGEIPDHTKITGVTATTRALEPGEHAPLPGQTPANTADNAPALYQATIEFSLQRTHTYNFGTFITDSQGRDFATSFTDCAPEVLTQPTVCTTTVAVPADALGPATFTLDAAGGFGGGFHEQPIPMAKQIRIPLELAP